MTHLQQNGPTSQNKARKKGFCVYHLLYFTNKLPSNIAVQPQGENNNTSTTNQAEAVDPTLFDTDPLQPGEVHLHSWMLYTSQAPVLDLTGEHIKTKEDIEATFHTLHLCPEEEEKQKYDNRQGKGQRKRTTKSK